MTRNELDSQMEAILRLTADWDDLADSEQRSRDKRIRQHQGNIRQAYGAKRGWTEVDRPFSVRALAPGVESGTAWESQFTDHRSF